MYYPPVNFHFSVHFGGPSNGQGSALSPDEVAFQSVAGLNVQLQTETIKEAGENRFEHVIPTRSKFSDLVLKRGLVYDNSPVLQWLKNAMEEFRFQPIDIDIRLLDEQHQALATWHVHHVWPKNWKIDEMNAETGKVLIETIELNYNFFRLRK